MRKTLLITGGSGYLGRHLTARAINDFDVYATYGTQPGLIKAGRPLSLNLADRDAVLRLISDLSPQAIIHGAALNPGRGSETEMRQVNIVGSRYVAEGTAAIGARLVHVSSDVVHSGRNAPYTDDAPPSPINDYGQSKAEAEVAVTEVDPTAVIVRSSLIYGLKEIDRGTESFVERLNSGQKLVLFSDVVRQPVWVETLAEALLKLTQMNFTGILNVAGRQPLSRDEFGRRMLAWWGIDTHGRLQSGRAADISDTIPLDVRIMVTKAEQLLKMTFPGVDEVLANAQP